MGGFTLLPCAQISLLEGLFTGCYMPGEGSCPAGGLCAQSKPQIQGVEVEGEGLPSRSTAESHVQAPCSSLGGWQASEQPLEGRPSWPSQPQATSQPHVSTSAFALQMCF